MRNHSERHPRMRRWTAMGILLGLLAFLGAGSPRAVLARPADTTAAATVPAPAAEPKQKPEEAARQQMEAEAEQMAQLAAELKASLDHSNEDMLSMQVVRKAAALEKLAHGLRTRPHAPEAAPQPKPATR